MQTTIDQTNETKKADSTIVVDPKISALFSAGAHIGHSKSRRHPKMGPYVFCTRSNVEIFDLELTEKQIKEAEVFLEDAGRRGTLVFWVGTKPAARIHIERIAQSLNQPFVTARWLGGLLTNFKAVEKRLQYWKKLEEEAKTGELGKYVKKERLLKLVELKKMTRMFGGLRMLTAIPNVVVMVDPTEESTAFRECQKKKIPIVALVNSDCNPGGIHYPIPANDDATAVIGLILDRLSVAFQNGKKEQAASSQEKV